MLTEVSSFLYVIIINNWLLEQSISLELVTFPIEQLHKLANLLLLTSWHLPTAF